MKVSHDKHFNLIYLKLTEHQISSTRRVTDDVVIDYDSDGNIVGIELLNAGHVADLSKFEYIDTTHERYRKTIEK